MRSRHLLTAISVLVATAVIGQACTDLSVVTEGQCGNRVVESSVGEECDSVAEDSSDDAAKPSHCGEVGTASECRYVWSEEYDCPRGWRPGADRRCRRASGAFQIADGSMRELVGSRVQVADHDGDGQLDVMVDAPDGQSTRPFYLSQTQAGFAAEAAASASSEAALADVTDDGVADVITTVQLDGYPSSVDDPSLGMVMRKGNLARVDDLRVYPGPTRYVSDFLYFWSPADSAEGDFDDLSALYESGDGPMCAGALCLRSEYDAATRPMPTFQDASTQQLLDSITAAGRQLAVLAPLRGHELMVLSAATAPYVIPLTPSSEPVVGVVVRDLDQDGNEDVGLVRETDDEEGSCALGFDVLYGPATDWTNPNLISRLAFRKGCGFYTHHSFAFMNDDDVPDIVQSGQRGAAYLSDAPFDGGDLGQTHVDAISLIWQMHSIGDLNGDGLDDVAAAFEESGVGLSSRGVDIVLGGDLLPLIQSRIVTSKPVRALLVTDLDGDALDDVVVALGDPEVADCEVPNDLMVAYGRAFAFPEDFAPIGGFPGVERLSAGRFQGPLDGVSDVAVTARCEGPDGSIPLATILRGDVERRPYAPLILDLEPMERGYFAPIRVFATDPGQLVDERTSLIVTSLELTGASELIYKRQVALLTPTDNGELTRIPPLLVPLPTDPIVDFAPQGFLANPSRPGQFLLASYVYPSSDSVSGPVFLQLDSYAVGSVIEHLNAATFHSPEESVLPTWSFAAVAAPQATALGVVVSLTKEDGTFFGAPLFWLAPWYEDGSFGAFAQVESPDGTHFTAITTLAAEFQSEEETQDLSQVFYIATEQSVYRVGCVSGRLPDCEGDPIVFTPLQDGLSQPLSLEIGALTGLAHGDFTQDGLDDLIVVGQQGARVIEQLPICATNQPPGDCLYD